MSSLGLRAGFMPGWACSFDRTKVAAIAMSSSTCGGPRSQMSAGKQVRPTLVLSDYSTTGDGLVSAFAGPGLHQEGEPASKRR